MESFYPSAAEFIIGVMLLLAFLLALLMAGHAHSLESGPGFALSILLTLSVLAAFAGDMVAGMNTVDQQTLTYVAHKTALAAVVPSSTTSGALLVDAKSAASTIKHLDGRVIVRAARHSTDTYAFVLTIASYHGQACIRYQTSTSTWSSHAGPCYVAKTKKNPYGNL